MSTYLITGANRGIGLEMARQVLNAGHRVIATCRHASSATDLSSLQGQLDIFELDVTDNAAGSALAERLDGTGVDVLVNNAGYMAENQSLDDMSQEQWMASFAVNTIAPWRIALAFRPHLLAAQSHCPRVVTLTSQMGSLERAGEDRVAYRSSKAAANMAMRTLALEWKEKGIVVCMLHPGWVRTDMGGSNAALGTAQSVSGMMQVIDELTLAQTGQFLDYEGQQIPW